jgi:RNA polymerase sigma-70 factor (ECF subfamily)
MVISRGSRVPVKNTPAEASLSTIGSDPSGSGGESSSGDDSVELFRVWCRRLRDGDRSALEAVFRNLHGPLVGYTIRFLAPDDADAAADVVQDAFVRVWEGRHRLDPERSLKALMYQTVRNLALNRSRNARTRASLLVERYEAPVRAAPAPDDALEEARMRARVLEWIDALPDRQREALRLSRFEGLDHREVAEVMGCSPRTVNNHLVRALRTIRERFAALEEDERIR